MALIKSLNNLNPIIAADVFLADNATIIGDVSIAKGSSVWFHSTIRGDVNSIIIGNNVNIQDGVVVHCTYQKTNTVIGNNVSIGHNAIIHGCKIEDNVLIGMGAIIMDGALIQKNSIVAAGSVVTKNTLVTSGSIFAGLPAKLIRNISEEEIYDLTKNMADNYIKYSSWYL